MKFFNNKEKVGSAFVLLFALIYLNATFDIPVHKMIFIEIFNARTLPMFLAIATIIICLILIFMPGGGLSDETMTDAVAGFQWKPCLLLTVLMLLYGLTFNFFGMPMNINWSKLTDFATTAEGWKTDFWIGFGF